MQLCIVQILKYCTYCTIIRVTSNSSFIVSISESLRMYPPVAMLMRKCTKNYVIPGSKITLEEGTQVIVPIHAMQNDPQYFPYPDKFDPERFSEENISQKTQYVYMPFGEGPRQCIGKVHD